MDNLFHGDFVSISQKLIHDRTYSDGIFEVSGWTREGMFDLLIVPGDATPSEEPYQFSIHRSNLIKVS